MSVAYVDSSAIVAIAFGEEGAQSVVTKLAGFSRLVSSNLLEAELSAACRREGQPVSVNLLARIGWILTHRPLSPEIKTALEAGRLRGADLWHVASALYAAPEPGAIAFVTLDRRQAGVAAALGFQLDPPPLPPQKSSQ
ncbi:MAG: PIN domain-containing protein [Gemmatimonadota bacterium]|nr:PIN domain-containing protein [Gemmatimonadota bacterium]